MGSPQVMVDIDRDRPARSGSRRSVIIKSFGVVKKKAILMVDCAIEDARERGLSAHDAIYAAFSADYDDHGSRVVRNDADHARIR